MGMIQYKVSYFSALCISQLLFWTWLILIWPRSTDWMKHIYLRTPVRVSDPAGSANLNSTATPSPPHWLTILRWEPGDLWLPEGDAVFAGCPEARCSFTDNRTRAWDADVIMFHALPGKGLKDEDMPTHERRADQLWAAYLHEAPTSRYMFRHLKKHRVFNLTISYHTGSDVWIPIARYVSPQNPDYSTIRETHKGNAYARSIVYDVTADLFPGSARAPDLRRKPRDAVLTSSYCGYGGIGTQRMFVAQQLAKYIDVDVTFEESECPGKYAGVRPIGRMLPPRYPACPSEVRPRGLNHSEVVRLQTACLKSVLSQYKFILAFENSWCEDYFTEKLFLNGLMVGEALPVSFSGMSAALLESVAPPGAYVSVDAFSSVGAAGAYLARLARNQSLYADHFAWRRRPGAMLLNAMHEQMWGGMCDLCREVHRAYRAKPGSRQTDITKFWSADAKCDTKKGRS